MQSKIIMLALFGGGGFFILLYTKPIKDFMGTFSWAERVFGQGGTYTFLKLLGVLMIIFAFMYGTGHLQDLAARYLGPLGGSTQGVGDK